jgi:multiple RNA-binding domain-containing protein 1
MPAPGAPAPAGAAAPPPAPQPPAPGPPAPPPTSRICVKNLPRHADEARLRAHFSVRGEVTDARVMRSPDGRSRLFGFVGFRSPAEAAAAVAYFDRSFMDAARLAVEHAFEFRAGAPPPPGAWSRHTAGTSAHARAAAAAAAAATGSNGAPLGARGAGGAAAAAAAPPPMKAREAKKAKRAAAAAGGAGGGGAAAAAADPQLAEFLALMAPRAAQPIWANDDAAPGAATPPGGAAAAGAERPAAGEAEKAGSDDEYVDLPARGAAGGSGGSDSEREGEEGGGGAPRDGLAADAAVSDAAYLRGRVRADFDAADAPGGSGSGSDLDASSEEEESEGEEEEAAAAPPPAALAAPAAPAAPAPAGDEIDEIFAGRRRGAAPRPGAGGPVMHPDRVAALYGAAAGAAAAGAAAGGSSAAADADADAAAAAPPAADPAAAIAETARLFVRNLPYSATEEDVRAAFEPHGEVAEAHLVLDRATRASKGYALVRFAAPAGALAAWRALDGAIFQGRLLHVLPGEHAPTPAAVRADAEEEVEGGAEGGEGAGAAAADGSAAAADKKASFKADREAARRAGAGAGADRAAWNSLFLRPATVADAVAARLGVPKAALLDAAAPDMAVRLALGEAQVIAETKAALAAAGVDVAALEASAAAAAAAGKAGGKATAAGKRSDRAILVKNLPFDSSEEELAALFAAHGPLARLVLPPARALALVEFDAPGDARRAYAALAYKRFHAAPLYLEWAPAGVFAGPPPPRVRVAAPAAPAAAAAAPPAAAPAAAPRGAAALAAAATPAAPDAAADSATVFAKNLAFATTDAAFLELFAARAGAGLRSAKVARRRGPGGAPLAAGYGFAEYADEGAARAAVAALQGAELDGHRLVLALAAGGGTGAGEAGGKAAKAGKPAASSAAGAPPPGADKLVVRNVAFEATRADVLALFAPFGAVRSCRLPRKFDGGHRGFAFLEFATPAEAAAAVEAVTGVHLYGRRLVLEWAAGEGGLDELRAKAADGFRGDAGALAARGGVRAAAAAAAAEAEAAAAPPPPKKRRRKGAAAS